VPLIVGLVVLGSFVLLESRIGEPLVPLRFFQNRTRVTANIVTLFFASVFFTMFFLLTLFWEEVEGWSAIKTGLAYLPFGVGIGAGIGIASALVAKIGVKPVLGAGFVLMSVGIAWLSSISVGGSYASEALPALVLMAIGSGFAFSGFGNASVHDVSAEDASLAAGVQNAVQQVGGAVGLAVLATLALRHSAALVASGSDPAHAATSGYVLAFRVGAVVLAVGAVMCVLLLETIRSDNEAVAA
jgi:predicted MFS family arabinose efflux permease